MTLARALLAISIATGLGLACERPSAPAPTPAPLPAAPAPTPAATPAPAVEDPAFPEPSLELPEVAGVHYLEVVTGDADPESALPMIVALHGNGAYPELMEYALLREAGTPELPIPPFEAPARFIFLRGAELVDPPGHARWFSITANEARASAQTLTALADQITARSDLVAEAITQLAKQRPTVGLPIVVGHSQGGILAFGLAVRHPDRFAAVYPLAGWLPAPLIPRAPADAATTRLAIVALHGDADTIVSYEDARASIEQLEQLGYSIELIPFSEVGHALIPLLAETRRLLAERALAGPGPD